MKQILKPAAPNFMPPIVRSKTSFIHRKYKHQEDVIIQNFLEERRIMYVAVVVF